MKQLTRVKSIAAASVAIAVLALCIVGCAPQQGGGGSVPEKKTDDSTQVAWTLDTDCVTCHTAENKTMTEGAYGAWAHAQEAQTACSTCHSDEGSLAKVHKDKTATDPMPKKLKKTSVDTETCQSSGCHDLTKDEMLALTAENTELIDTKGTHVNPHDVMDLTAGHADIQCSNCHNMHAEKAPTGNTCVGCHHSGVYECNTCH